MSITKKLDSSSVLESNPVSIFWLLAPIVLLFVSNIIVLFSVEIDSIQQLYYTSQIDWFISLNLELNKVPDYVWSNVTQLGEAMVLLPLIFVCTLSKRNAWKAIMFSVPVASFLSIFFKRLTSIPRPAAIIDHSEITLLGKVLIGHTSLPSGHTITVFAASIAVLMTLYPSMKTRHDKLVLSVLLALTVLISLSRVAVGAHWPLDLFIGAACGWIAGYSGVYWFNKSSQTVKLSNIWNYIFILLFSILSILLLVRVSNFSLYNIIILISMACSVLVVMNLVKEQRTIKNQA